MREDPRALAAQILAEAEKAGTLREEPAEPEDPGEMPDPVENPEGAKAWSQKLRAFHEHKAASLVAGLEQKVEQRLAPLDEMRKAQAFHQEKVTLQQNLKVDDDVMTEVLAESERLKKDRVYAWESIRDRVLARRAAAAKKEKLKTGEVGTEMKPGLPRTGARKPVPKPTGDTAKDIERELDHEGVEFSD
jgi:hypothetical protein